MNMNTSFLTPKPWLAIVLLCGEYVLLGWYLAAHHVFWLISTLIVATSFTLAWKSHPFLESLSWLSKQQVVVVISVSFFSSLVVALALVQPILLSLTLLPMLTLLYALFEMRTADFKQVNVFLWIALITVFSLGLGEAIDLFVTPSMRY